MLAFEFKFAYTVFASLLLVLVIEMELFLGNQFQVCHILHIVINTSQLCLILLFKTFLKFIEGAFAINNEFVEFLPALNGFNLLITIINNYIIANNIFWSANLGIKRFSYN